MSELETQELNNSHNFGKDTSKNFNKQLSLAKSKNATSQKAYFKNLLNAQKQLSKDNPVIPLCTEAEDHLVNSNLRGV
ncbi:peptide ABC transporter substrate-binding protein, partial [Streptococcus anginosus]|nr:peptide ABC transporter substrate-binding protein [Streptococcus anginosus]